MFLSNRYFIFIQVICFFLFAIFLQFQVVNTFNPNLKEASFAYHDPFEDSYKWIKKKIHFTSKSSKAQALIQSFCLGPSDPLMRSTIPANISINFIFIDGGELFIDFDSSKLSELTKHSEKIFISCLISTLQKNAAIIEPLNKVYFTFGGMTFPYLKGAFNYDKGIDL